MIHEISSIDILDYCFVCLLFVYCYGDKIFCKMISEIFNIDILDYCFVCLLCMHSVAMVIRYFVKGLVKSLVWTSHIIVLLSFVYALCCYGDKRFCKRISEMFRIDILDYFF